MSFPSFTTRLLGLLLFAVAVLATGACGNSQNPPRKLTGIFVHPANASAYSNSAQSQVVYTVVAGYLGGDDVPITSGVQWQITGGWVTFDTPSMTATCKTPAPPDTFFNPMAASISATATVEGQTLSDTAVLYCF